MAATLDDTRPRVLARRIAAAGQGNFLYARHVLDELLAEPGRLARDPLRLELPDGLPGIYQAFLDREVGRRGTPANEQRWQEVYRPLLGLLAVAQGDGLTPAQLTVISELRRSQVDDALRATSQYLTGADPDGPVRIWHQSFRDYLLAAGPHCVYGDEANATLAAGLLRRVPASPNSDQPDWLAADAYTRTHLATHAARAGQLDHLLDDPGFLVTADPSQLLPALAAATSPSALQTARVYRHAARSCATAHPGRWPPTCSCTPSSS